MDPFDVCNAFARGAFGALHGEIMQSVTFEHPQPFQIVYTANVHAGAGSYVDGD